jgi:hypothetical protein
MRAIILAAGRGSRMKALTSDKPKCLVELRGRSLLERQLEALRGAVSPRSASSRGTDGSCLPIGGSWSSTIRAGLRPTWSRPWSAPVPGSRPGRAS